MSDAVDQDSVKKILLAKLRKALLPDFTNRLTWLFGSAGIALIVGPGLLWFAAKISTKIYGVPIELDLTSEDHSWVGIFLCLLAVVQNIAYQFKGMMSEMAAISSIQNSQVADVLDLQLKHEESIRKIDSNIAMDDSKRKHDLRCIAELSKTFPFEESCNNLVVAADLGISYAFQDCLENLTGMHHVSNRLYDKEAEAARKELIEQAMRTQSVLSSKLADDSRFPSRYVPFFEQKHNGMRAAFWESHKEMQDSCYRLIKCYRTLVETLQERNLWGVDS